MADRRYRHGNRLNFEDGWYVDRLDRVWYVHDGWMTMKDSDRKSKDPVDAAPFRRVHVDGDGYGMAEAVADRDEAYRLLHAAQARLDVVESIVGEAWRDQWSALAMYSGVKAVLR